MVLPYQSEAGPSSGWEDRENPARDAGNTGWGVWLLHPLNGDLEVRARLAKDGLSDALSIGTVGIQPRLISTTSFKRVRDVVLK